MFFLALVGMAAYAAYLSYKKKVEPKDEVVVEEPYVVVEETETSEDYLLSL